MLSKHRKEKKQNAQTISGVAEMLGESCADLISSFVCIDASSRSDRLRRCKRCAYAIMQIAVQTRMEQLKNLRLGSHCFVSFKFRLFGGWAPRLRAPIAATANDAIVAAAAAAISYSPFFDLRFVRRVS